MTGYQINDIYKGKTNCSFSLNFLSEMPYQTTANHLNRNSRELVLLLWHRLRKFEKKHLLGKEQSVRCIQMASHLLSHKVFQVSQGLAPPCSQARPILTCFPTPTHSTPVQSHWLFPGSFLGTLNPPNFKDCYCLEISSQPALAISSSQNNYHFLTETSSDSSFK